MYPIHTQNFILHRESQELKSDQLDWVKETTSLVYKLLAETPPNGKRFAECVKSILKREEHWNNWKNDGCPGLLYILLFY